MSTDEPTLDLGAIRVHCFACPHWVERFDPGAAHDEMERHYEEAHAALIDRMVAW